MAADRPGTRFLRQAPIMILDEPTERDGFLGRNGLDGTLPVTDGG